MNEKNRKGRKRALAVLAFAVLFLIGAGIFIIGESKKIKNVEMGEETEEAVTSVFQPVEETQLETEEQIQPEYISPVDFSALSRENSDIVAWIRIPDTPVDYPIVQTTDNEKYLHTDFYGNKSAAGAIFLDYESDSDLEGRHNILYGHHMKNGSMFKAIVKYKDEKYFQEHPFFTIYTPEKEIKIKVISAYYGEPKAEMRQTHFSSEAEFDNFVKKITEKCTFALPLEAPIDSLYTLITCSYEFPDARTFVIGAAVDENDQIIYRQQP